MMSWIMGIKSFLIQTIQRDENVFSGSMNQCGGEILINFWFKIPLQIRYLWRLSAGEELWSCLMPQVTLSAKSWALAMFYYSSVSEKVLTSLYAMLFVKMKESIPFSQCIRTPRLFILLFTIGVRNSLPKDDWHTCGDGPFWTYRSVPRRGKKPAA